MDRNTITGLLLMMALLFGYQYYITPSSEEIAAWEAQQEAEAISQDSLARLDEKRAQAERATMEALQNGTSLGEASEVLDNLTAELQRRYGMFGGAVSGKDRDIVMENDQIRVVFNTRGGLPVEAT
ncbi:MAG TPA: hypothetical protein DCX49_00820, partial [Flavobacteriales bacterium]|nr:hypothetical protein [Flavobacteriales bacterium]